MSDIPTPHPHSGDAHGVLSKKVGPLSVGMYLIAFVVMLGVWYYWRSRKTTTVTPTTFTGDGSTPTAAQNMAGSSGGSAASGSSSGSGSAATTLGQWLTNAANYLTGTGADPTQVQAALSAYGSGQQPTPAQQILINQALAAEGSPPSGVIPVNTATQNVAYTVQPGDTLTSVAQQFFGDSTRWHDIYAANMGLFGPNTNLSTPLHAGETLNIPGSGMLPTPGARDVYSGVPSGNKYTLQFGDSLIQLAERFYGDPNKWTAIAAANPKIIPDVNHPPVGTTIVIPMTAPSVSIPSAGSAIGL